jgi:branched-chain amino acid transport system substrate-binding protein
MRGTRFIAGIISTLAAFPTLSLQVSAEETTKIGMITPLTGPLATNGRQLLAGAQLYIRQHGEVVAGKRIELVVRDDSGAPATSSRLAQELIVRDKVAFIAGATNTAGLIGIAPLVSEARIPTVIMLAGTSGLVAKSPYFVRTSFTLGQSSGVVADWAISNGIRRVVIMVSDFAPGHEAEAVFRARFTAGGGEVASALRFPLQSIDFAPYLQKARDSAPDAVFVFVPSGQGDAFAKQFAELGLDKAGIRLIGTGDLTDDDLLPKMGDAVLGAVTAHFYSAAHPSAENRAFVEAFRKEYGYRPNFMAVSAYDGMHVIYEALRRCGGTDDGDALVAAMKGLSWESPRGPMAIDAETRDVVDNIYLRKVGRIDGEFYNIEFATYGAVGTGELSRN